jgi:hypothetical protein
MKPIPTNADNNALIEFDEVAYRLLIALDSSTQGLRCKQITVLEVQR